MPHALCPARLAPALLIPLVFWIAWAIPPACAQAQDGARLAFPNHGAVHAFVIFVQHEENAEEGDHTSDPATEWPRTHSLDPERLLPAWAGENRLLAPPGADPAAFDPGSLSAFYHTMSHGRFTVKGYVYPRVYAPEHPVSWYHDNRGDFPNGAVALSHEILTSSEIRQYFSENPDSLNLSLLDTYRNGSNEYASGGDGIFDMIILVNRSAALPGLRRLANGKPSSGSSISSLGADTEVRPGEPDYLDPATDAFRSDPVRLGSLRVIDNLTSGSGIITRATTRKQSVRIIAHEIGHRHFGPYHTCDSEIASESDCIGIMGGAYLTMSAGDRIKLGWAEVVNVDVKNHSLLRLHTPDALASGKVFRIREGRDACGDLIVEARFWSNFWDSPPNAADPGAPFYGNDDGDSYDLFLPQEGLYLYKAPESGNSMCGGRRNPAYDYLFYSSLENSGISRRLVPFSEGPSEKLRAFRPGGTYRVALEPGDMYTPFTLPGFYYHANPSLDRKLTLTDITREGGAFALSVWTDYLAAPPEQAALRVENYPDPFSDFTIIRYEMPEEGEARLTIYDLMGRRVAGLVSGRHQAGVHEWFFDASGLAGGLYWCVIQAGDRTTRTPLHLVR